MSAKKMLSTLFIFVQLITFISVSNAHFEGDEIAISEESNNSELFYEMGLDKAGLSIKAFLYGIAGYQKMIDDHSIENSRYLTIIDFEQPSTNKRLYLLDMEKHEIALQTYVAHGRNTGHLKAEKFSNISGSLQSSLGFYLASETYIGKYGLSLRLDGMESGINSLARKRAVVMHPAWYASEDFVKEHGYLGRSFGCPAVPYAKHKEIIQKIKEKSCLFIYQKEYNNIAHKMVSKNELDLFHL